MLAKTDGAVLGSIFVQPRQWFLLRVMPQCEARVSKRCDDLGIEAYCPLGQAFDLSRRPRRGELPRVSRPVFPGYLFVSLVRGKEHFALFSPDRSFRDRPAPLIDVEIGDVVMGPRVISVPPIDGSLGFVSYASGPRIVARDIINDLRAREEAGEFDEIALAPGKRFYVPRWCRRGAVVAIVDGPFKDQTAEIRKLVSARAIGVSLLGRWRGWVTMPLAHCAKLAA